MIIESFEWLGRWCNCNHTGGSGAVHSRQCHLPWCLVIRHSSPWLWLGVSLDQQPPLVMWHSVLASRLALGQPAVTTEPSNTEADTQILMMQAEGRQHTHTHTHRALPTSSITHPPSQISSHTRTKHTQQQQA